VQLMLLSSVLPNPDARARTAFNAAAARQVDDFRDFIRLHYVSERRDTPFWRDVAANLPGPIADRLAAWGGRVPGPQDFTPFPMGLPHTDHHLHVPVLDGLGLVDPAKAKAWLADRPKLRAQARAEAAKLTGDYKRAAGRAIGHRAFLDGLRVNA